MGNETNTNNFFLRDNSSKLKKTAIFPLSSRFADKSFLFFPCEPNINPRERYKTPRERIFMREHYAFSPPQRHYVLSNAAVSRKWDIRRGDAVDP
jgi:hypothetical protein